MSEAPMSRRRRYLRRAARVASALLVLLVVLVALALLSVRAYLDEERSRALAERIVNEVLAGTYRIGSFTWEAFPYAVTVRDVVVEAPGGETVARAERLTVEIALLPLAWREVHLEEIVLTGAWVAVEPLESGEGYALVEAVIPPPGEEGEGGEADGPAWSVSLSSIRVEDLDVRVVTGSLRIEVGGVSMGRGELFLDLPRVRSAVDGLSARTVTLAVAGRTFAGGPVRVAASKYVRTGVPEEAEMILGGVEGTLAGVTVRGRGGLGALSDGLPMALSFEGHLAGDLADPALREQLPEGVRSLVDRGVVELDVSVGGTLDAPRVEATARTRELAPAGVPLTSAVLEAAYYDGQVTLSRGVVQVPGGRVTVRGEGRLGGPSAGWRATAALESLPLRALAAKWVDPQYLPETVQGTVSAQSTSFTTLSVRLEPQLEVIGLPASAPPGLPDRFRVAGRLRLEPRRARLETLTVEGENLTATARGPAPYDLDAPLDLTVSVRHAAPAPLLRPYELPVTLGAVTVEARVTGTYRRPQADGVVSARDVRVTGLPEADVVAPVRFDGRALHLAGAEAALAGGRVVASGTVDLLDDSGAGLDKPRLDLQASAHRLDLGALSDGRAQGWVDATATVRGAAADPVGQGEVTVTDLVVSGVPFSGARAQARIFGRSVRVSDLDLALSAGGTVRGDGVYDLDAETVSAALHGDGLPLTLLDGFLDEPLPVSALADFELAVRGTARDPRATGDFALREVSTLDTPVGTVAGRIDEATLERVRVTAEAKGPAGRLSLNGAYVLETGTVTGRARATGLVLGRLPGLAPATGEDETPAVDGALTLDLAFDGPLPIPGIDGRVHVTDLTVAGVPVEDGQLAAHLFPASGGVAAEVSGVGLEGAEVVFLSGPPYTITGQGTLRLPSLARLIRRVADLDLDAAVAGRFSGRVEIGESVTIAADATLPEVRVTVSDTVLTAPRPVRLAYAGDRVVVHEFALTGDHGGFELSGTAGEALDLAARGFVELRLLALFVSSISRASGTVEMDLALAGTPEAPAFTGEVSFPGPVSVRPRTPLVPEIVVTKGRVSLTPGRAELVGVEGKVRAGQFQASGEAALSGLEVGAWSLKLTGQNLPLRTQDLIVEANPDLSATGRGRRARVQGTVDVVRGRYLQKFELKRFSFRPQATEVETPLAEAYPWLAEIELDVGARSVGTMVVEANAGPFALELGLDSDVRVTGNAADPRLEGRVEASQGHITFPKAKLDVIRAVIEFMPTPAEGIRPTLDLRAEGEVVTPVSSADSGETYLVTLGLEGDPGGEMPLTLTSNPPLSELEILSLLTTGRVNPTLSDGTGGNLSKGDAALAFAGSQIAEPLTRFLTQQLEERLNLEVQLGAEVTTAGVTVTAGKELSRRLRLEGVYQQSLDQSIAQGRARYLLTDDIFLEATGETVSGTSTSASALEEGERGRVELKLRLFGD